jgi:nitrite reductase (NADH) small subunit
VENKCSHKEGLLSEGIISEEHLFCLEDGKVQEPDFGCVKTYGTLVEEGEVFLLL